MAREDGGAITLPKWFIWLAGIVQAGAIPIAVGGTMWAWNINETLVRIEVRLERQEILAADIAKLESELEEHKDHPRLHEYEMTRMHGELSLLRQRVEALENNQNE